MTTASTLLLATIGLAILGHLSSRPDEPGRSPLVRMSKFLARFFVWALVIGGVSAGIALLCEAVTLGGEVAFYGVLIGLFGLFLIVVSVVFLFAVREWLHLSRRHRDDP